jgi:hypothetical protein
MAGNPRDHVKGKGFWDGGSSARSENGQSAGRTSGFPGERKPSRVGLRTDLEFPEKPESDASEPAGKA